MSATTDPERYARINKNGPSIGIISISAIADDPRVRREGDAFHAFCWDVIAVGLPGAKSPLPNWKIIEVSTEALQSSDSPISSEVLEQPIGAVNNGSSTVVDGSKNRSSPSPPAMSLRNFAKGVSLLLAKNFIRRKLNVLRYYYALLRSLWETQALRSRLRIRYVTDLLMAPYSAEAADRAYWKLNSVFQIFYSTCAQFRPDVWLANDWTTLPIARRLAREQDVLFAYDTHELATSQYEHRLKWRLTDRRIIKAMEKIGIREAAVVSCVSEGIAERLQQLYWTRRRPLVIRNVPNFQSVDFQQSQHPIRVLYHGIIARRRGLEECIQSVPLWETGRTLAIRGPAEPSYLLELQSLVDYLGIGDRVSFLAAVPMTELVQEARLYDIGIFIFPGTSPQQLYSLPNKLFEYMMAGLALCVSALPEMASLVRSYEVGVLVDRPKPLAIATAINTLDLPSIDQYKKNSLKAAQELNWEQESRRLLSAYNAISNGTRSAS